MVLFVRHRQVDDGQHHEDKRLQGDDQDVEHSPRPLQNYAQAAKPEQTAAEHHSNQNEDQFAGIHVAEQTQSQGNRLGDQCHELQQEVHRDQQGLNEDVLAAERVQGQFADEAADTLDLDAVENDQREHRQGHAQGSVRVSGRNGTERNVRIASDHHGQLRNPVDRYQVDSVHQEDPDEDGQCQRCNHRATAMEAVFHAAIDEFDQYFNEVLQSTRLTGSRLLRRHAENQNEDQTQRDRPAESIDVESPEAHFFGFCCGVGKTPPASWVLTEGQVLQVVLDIARSGCFCHGCLKRPKVSKVLFSSAGARTS